MTEESKRLAAYGIEQMFKKGTFYIGDIDNACKLMGMPANGPSYDKLRVLHCEKINDIPEDIRQRIPIWINDVLGGPRLSVVQIPALREGKVHALGFEDFDALPPPEADK